MRGSILAVVLGATAGLWPGLARAQSDPSVTEITRALTPQRGALYSTRCRCIPGASIDLDVEFATGSVRLTAPARALLDRLGAAMQVPMLLYGTFLVEGHTDTVGTARYNLALSRRRAEAVAQYLERHFGIAPDRLFAYGLGEEGLKVPTPPQTPEIRNRRVVILTSHL